MAQVTAAPGSGAVARLIDQAQRLAAWSYRAGLLGNTVIILLVTNFFCRTDSPPRFVLFYFVLPAGVLALLSEGRRKLTGSYVLWAAVIYLAAMLIASLAAPEANFHDVWRQFRISLLIVAFLVALGGLVAARPDFTGRLFLLAGIAAAASAALNVGLYFEYLAPAHRAITAYRLHTMIGMPGYSNATNVSATYAVFFVGATAVLLRGGMSTLPRTLLTAAAAILLAAVLLTQARSALLGAVAGLAVLTPRVSLRSRLVIVGIVFALAAAMTIAPLLQQVLLHRGSSYRLEVWAKFLALIAERPLIGYGSFSPAGITLHTGKFLDQAHNLVLSAWFRGGLVSGLAMAAILLGGIYWARRHHQTTGDAAPLAVMITIAIAGMFDYQLLVTYPTWPWVTFWLPFGLAIGAEMAWRGAQHTGRSPGAMEARRGPASDVAPFSGGGMERDRP
jgi:O-antigen ligase